MQRRWKYVLGLLGASVLATTGGGCQTWVPEVGMTLPSPGYLEHPPQYIPRTPGFPHAKELASQERAAAQQQANQPVR